MCGRFILTVDFKTLLDVFHAQFIGESGDYSRRYNITPSQNIPVITRKEKHREISQMRWGLIPHWAKDVSIGNKLINARAETIDQKPSFKSSFRHRRCLIPADGFYEWKRQNSEKIPMRITLLDKEVFAFAGIWAHWISPEGKDIHSCSIITTKANNFVKEIHDRMPVILTGKDEYKAWLELDEQDRLKELLRPYEGQMSAYQVSSIINSPKFDNPSVIEKLD